MRVIKFYPDAFILERNRELSVIAHGEPGYVIIGKKILNPIRLYQHLPGWCDLKNISSVRLIVCNSATNVSGKSYWNSGGQSFGSVLSTILRNVTCECYSGEVMSQCDPQFLWAVYQNWGHEKTENILREFFTDGVIKSHQTHCRSVAYLNGKEINHHQSLPLLNLLTQLVRMSSVVWQQGNKH